MIQDHAEHLLKYMQEMGYKPKPIPPVSNKSMEDIAKEVFAEFGRPFEVTYFKDPDEILKMINQEKLSRGDQNE